MIDPSEKTVLFSKDLLQMHQLCFIHIPKTAGTSFMDILRSIVGKENLLHISPEVLNGYDNPGYDIDKFNCLSGHFTFEIYKLLEKTPLFLTFLREPLTRSISTFQEYRRVNVNVSFVQQLPGYDFYLQLDKMTFENFINHPHFSDTINNLQTRMLGLSINAPINSLADLRPIADDKHKISLDLAKERLEKFMFIGIQEEFQKSLDMIAYQFGMFPLMNIPKLNESKRTISQEDISDAIVNRVHELNILDDELYEFGVRLFKKRYQQMVIEMAQTHDGKEVLVTEMLSRRYWEQEEKTRNILYNLDVIYPRQGWYEVENVDKQQWMWSGPETISTIDIPIDRSINLRFRFQIKYYIKPDIFESLELFIDDQRVHLIHFMEVGIHLFTGIILANPKRKYIPTKFSFRVNRTAYPPGMTEDSPGARLLGIALSWIEISPLE